MYDYYLGTTLQFAGSFAPQNWAFCAGQLVTIPDNAALFSLLGTSWGGDGRSSFGLPDLQGRTPVGFGQGSGLPSYTTQIGLKFGSNQHVLDITEMPQHNHEATFTPTGGGSGTSITATATVNAGSGSDASAPTGKYWGVTPGGIGGLTSYSNTGSTTMASDAVDITISGGGGGITGGYVEIADAGTSQAFGLYQPSIVIPFIICTVGLYPSRN
ncbi:Phage Tail Collar Domain protein [Marinomonas aquimarina]|uniref:Phage Tail Collar Domain protein n=1 Tax=Marinomonas aquimarina TaxID=295068 RepID=A0A1A8TGI0_9GAMM|nr:tail fiber protein [Marinomonas aquimarina]SBS31357.1 Phage Tail Collar Domain protein [Marinomonas aquimarina]